MRPVAALLGVLLLLGSANAGSDSSATDATRRGSPQVTPATATDVLAAVRSGGGRVTLVNVWATWCGPCREEMPGILALARKYRDRGMRLVLVSGDFDSERDEVVKFLAGLGVDFPSFIKTGPDMEFIDTLEDDWSGALPASFLYDGKGRQVDFWEGKITAPDLEKKILGILDKA